MQRNTYFRGIARPQASAGRPIVSSGGIGQNAHPRVHSIRRQAESQARGGDAARISSNRAFQLEGDEGQDIENCDLIDITEEVLSQQAPQHSQGRYRYKQVIRNASLIFSHREKSVYKFNEIELKPGTCVELCEPCGNWEADFVEIKAIWASRSDGSVIIRGLPYTRTRNLHGLLENKRNEVCQLLEIDADDQRPDEAQALVEISPHQVMQVRTLNMTNAKYPTHKYGGEQQWLRKTPEVREEQGPLTCRWKFHIQYQNARARQDNKVYDGALIKLRQTEADDRFRESDEVLWSTWRGRKYPGGSGEHTTKDQKRTFGDAFCSAGGASRGADMAGLKVEFGVDNWDVACATWRHNFPGARMIEQHIADFIDTCEIDWRSHPIDILHLSPPCQPFSSLAYVHASRGNEMPEARAVLFSCGEIINKIRSRLFTLEETFGLTQAAHKEYLNSLIQQFTRHDYSVRWKNHSLVEYGLPQTRKRLIMIGACPGEQLPPWPPATHAQRPTGSQESYVTEAKALRCLRGLNSRRDPLHDVANAIDRPEEPPRDGNAPFPRTIIGSGTQGVRHFSERRDYTLREMACLQGFPTSHQFTGSKTDKMKQMGNAFPPCVAKAFYDYLGAWLDKVDGVQRTPAQAQARRFPDPRLGGQLVDRHQGNLAPAFPTETRNHVNGDLNDDEAFELALQESMREIHSTPIIDLSDEEEDEHQQYSPVSAVGTALERMSIAPSDHEVVPSIEPGDRSRSVTLDFSPEPSPGPGHHAKPASQKRSLDSMHDGEADEVMKKESPPKRENVVDTDRRNKGVAVHDGKIPSRLPRYAGPPRPYDAEGEIVAVGQPDRRNGDGVQLRESHENSSIRQGDGSHGTTIVDDVDSSKSDGEENVWTF